MDHCVYTDLALEAHSFFREGRRPSLPGVEEESRREDGCAVTRIRIVSQEAAQRLGKAQGCYVTLEAEDLSQVGREGQERVSSLLARELRALMPPPSRTAPVLVIGLGNRSITPDALGPMTVDGVMVSRHILSVMPEGVDARVRSLCALAPGVLGVTGLETAEVIRGVMDRVKPACVVAVDALASRNTHRIGNTFQLTDTGIRPGAGVGNRRMELNRKTLGAPVLALGVPTVVYAMTIVRDAMLAMDRAHDAPSGKSEEEMDQVVSHILPPPLNSLVVTPKDVDQMVRRAAAVLSLGINLWAHDGLSVEEIQDFMH